MEVMLMLSTVSCIFVLLYNFPSIIDLNISQEQITYALNVCDIIICNACNTVSYLQYAKYITLYKIIFNYYYVKHIKEI